MSFRAFPDNQQLTKHVESTSVSCLDAGSTPASSTWKGVKLPRNTKKDTDSLFDYQCLSLFCTVLLSGLPACPNLGALVLCGRQGVRLPQCDSPTAENGNMMHDSGYVGLSYQGSRIVSRQPQFLWMYFLRIHQLFARFHCTWLNIRFIISVFIIHNSLLDVAKLLFLHLQIIMLKI